MKKALALIAIITVFAFSPSFFSFFASDDFEWLAVSRDRDITQVFTTNTIGEVGGGNYNPVVSIYFWLFTNIFGASPIVFHVLSVALHLLVVLLIYLIAKHAFNERVAFFSAFIFAVYFNHAEAVNWVAAVVHLLATAGSLACVYFFLLHEKKEHWKWYALSIACFALAIFSKEIAITIPVILLIINPRKFVRVIPFAVILLFFFLLRDGATAIALGYYGKESFGFDWRHYIKNVFIFLFAFISTGRLREILINSVNLHFVNTAAIAVPIIAVCLAFITRKSRSILLLLTVFFILLAPYLPLFFSSVNNEGERYLYLPMTVLAIIIGILFDKFANQSRKFATALFCILIAASTILLFQKSLTWMHASHLSRAIVEDFGHIAALDEENPGVIFLNLPDNYAGAQVMRNAVEYAIKIYYPDYPLDAVIPRVRIMVPKEYLSESFIDISYYEPPYQFILKTKDDSYNFTGYDRRESTEMVFELWGYDYRLSTSSMAYFRIEPALQASMQDHPVHFLYFDAGHLHELHLPVE